MTPEEYQTPREAKTRDAEGENTQPLSLNYNAFVKLTPWGVAMVVVGGGLRFIPVLGFPVSGYD